MINKACFEPKVGALVSVASRTWPGINKPGGVGKVSEITREDGIIFVHVEYVLGGKENAIELEFVQEHSFDEENKGRPSRSRRDRSSESAQENTSAPTKKDTAAKISKKKQPANKKKAALSDASSKRNKVNKPVNSVTANKAKPKKRKLSVSAKPVKSKKVKKASTKPETKKVPAKKSEKEDQTTESISASPPPCNIGRASSEAKETPSRITGVLKNVYSSMSKKAASFVETVIGKTGSEPSSPESTTSSLELEVHNE
jgi:hypothetical protein